MVKLLRRLFGLDKIEISINSANQGLDQVLRQLEQITDWEEVHYRVVIKPPHEWSGIDREALSIFLNSVTGQKMLDFMYHSLHKETMQFKPRSDWEQGKAIGIALNINMMLSYSKVIERDRGTVPVPQKDLDQFQEAEEITQTEPEYEPLLY